MTWQKYTICELCALWIDSINLSDYGKNTDYCRQNATKGCHGQTAEHQAGTSKGKLTNTKLLTPSLT